MDGEKMLQNAVKAHILDAPYAADKPYTYYLPPELRGEAEKGKFVSLPFGRGNRQTVALIVETLTVDDLTGLKAVTAVLEAGGVKLNEELLSLCLFLKEQTFCTVGEAVYAMIPGAALKGLCACVRIAGEPAGELNERASQIYGFIREKTEKDPEAGCPAEKIAEKFGEDAPDLLKALTKLGLLERFYRDKDRSSVTYECVYAVSPAEHTLPGGKKQREIYDAVSLAGELGESELREKFGQCRQQLKALLAGGQFIMHREEVYRRAYLKKHDAPPDGNLLTDDQEKAKDAVCRLIDGGKPGAALLYGVTGSGKTRVMKAVIDHVLSLGKSVIVLVPEIALTPQTVGVFSAFYGDGVALIHSGLSAGQRYDEWRRIRDGRARICVGTRSAIFAPFENLGLIIIDEEQEHTYKSDMTPRYHARDVARFRCGRQNAVMMLCSATPSIESYYKAKEGKYTLCTLPKRYGDAPLPRAILCDMRGGKGFSGPIGALLANELAKNVERGEQSILFVGRRGYNSYATCTLCGETLTCPHCSVSLTYHALGRYRPEENSASERAKHGVMVCHYCGFRRQVPDVCPKCGSSLLQFLGCGTQFVENELERIFPGVPTLRLDADTTGNKDSFETKLDSFRRGEAQIMLGTQMVTKGHDFPNVTLVGVTNADAGLFIDDYRAGEHLFSLVTQVIGRAGRGERPGRAIVQTYNPDHRTLKMAVKQDYPAFYEDEIAFRRALVFPPFCDILLISLTAGEESEVRAAAELAAKKLAGLREDARYEKIPMSVYGPFEAPVFRLKDQYRMRMVVKTRAGRALREMIAELLVDCAEKFKRRATISADLNPSAL